MKIQHLGLIIIAVLAVTLGINNSAYAKTKTHSGSYSGSRGGKGTYKRSVTRENGHLSKETTWQNEKGQQGSRRIERSWNKDTGTGKYSVTTTRPNGKTTTREGTLTKTGDGTLAVEGTRTGPNGKVTNVEKAVTKTGDGSAEVKSTLTGPDGKTLNVDKTIQKKENGRVATGTYETGDGKTGTFEREIEHDGNTTAKHFERTNAEGETHAHDVTRTRVGDVINRESTFTGPDGKMHSNSQTATVDTNQPAAVN